MAPAYLRYRILPSTHDHALSLLSKTTPPEGTVIVAEYQDAGKGRFERSWQSDPGENALLSVIYYPKHLHPGEAFYLNIISTLATVKILTSYDVDSILIKWPNDVLVKKKKIAGTLIQNHLGGSEIASSIISIGINVNQKHWEDSRIHATSLAKETGSTRAVRDIVEGWIEAINVYYEQTRSVTGRQSLKSTWMNQLIGFGEMSRFSIKGGQSFEAVLTDVMDDGNLVLTVDGKKKAFFMDEVRYLISG